MAEDNRWSAERFVVPVIAKLHRDHPAIVVELSVSEALVDVIREGFDLDIRPSRLVAPEQSPMPGRSTATTVKLFKPRHHATPSVPTLRPSRHQKHRAALFAEHIMQSMALRSEYPMRKQLANCR